MKSSITLLASLVVAAGSLPALAGGPVVMAPEAAPIVTPAPMMMPANGDWTAFFAGLSLGYAMDAYNGQKGNGMLYGARAGYDYDFGQFVLGAEASYDMGNIAAGGATLKNISRVGVRVGADLGTNLIYAAGGAAWASQTLTDDVDKTDMGWFAGLGAEHKFTDNWSLGGEILTNQFKDFANTGNYLRATTVAMNVNYRF